jgi:uncharacterized protein YkwD
MSSLIRNLTRTGSLLMATVAATATLTAGPLAGSAHAVSYAPTLSTFDHRLLYDINHARAARGIRTLTAVAGTTDIAHGWSCHMASSLTLAHNWNLAAALDNHGSSLWTTYGENVGMEPTTLGADALFRAYMNSAPHRANILDPDFKYLGYRWNTLDFVGKYSTSYNYAYGPTRRTC